MNASTVLVLVEQHKLEQDLSIVVQSPYYIYFVFF